MTTWLKVDKDRCTVVFEIGPTQSISHSELEAAVNTVFSAFQNARCDAVKITGRGPTWLYSAVVHAVAHLAKAVLVYDAVSKVWVVVVSHDPDFHVGQVIGGEPW